MDYLPVDALLAKTMKYQLSDSGIICVDAPTPVEIVHSLDTDSYVVNSFDAKGPRLHIPADTENAVDGCWVFLLVLHTLEVDIRVCPLLICKRLMLF